MNKKLSEEDVCKIRELIEMGKTALKIAEEFKVAPNTISDIKMNRTWKYVGK